MMSSILAIGKSVPPYSISQRELAGALADLMQLSDEETWFIEKIYKHSTIERRYSVIPDIMHPHTRFRENSPGIRVVGMSERNAIYKQEAPMLAEKAAKTAIEQWGRNSKSISHVISVSCTGVMSPGIECELAHRLGLNPNLFSLGINFMGCFGAFKALKIASKIARDNPKNRILVVSTELCTLHFKPHTDMESMVIQSLFGDGSAAVIMGCDPQDNEASLFNISEERACLIENTQEDMTWDACDEGFAMKLSPRIPGLIRENISSFVHQLTGDIPLKDCVWAIHPGGKSIVEAIENALSLDRSSTISSWNILSQYGNLSSATFLYVLEDICQRHVSNKPIVGLGFGPGLSIEGLMLHKN